MWLSTAVECHSVGRDDVWNAYLFTDNDWSIELKFSTDQKLPDIFVYSYAGRTYKAPRVEALDMAWADSGEALADAFVDHVGAILAEMTPEQSPR